METKVLLDEMKETGSERRLGVDFQCPMLEERHKTQECDSEHLSKKIGSTKSGVGACNAERALRMVKLARQEPQLRPFVGDTVAEIHKTLSRGGNVMVEGTQGTFLSLYHGTYPYVTSKDVTASQACADVGIGPTEVDDVMVIFKAYVTRVGEGPLEGQLSRDEVLRRGWMEHGTVTGRERARGIKSRTELPLEAREFISKIERETQRPVTVIGTGASESDIIDLRSGSKTETAKPTLVVKGKKSTSMRG